jgi:8-oxo-dGTP pyrophosphatase MutT (NUDIX family)
VSHEPDRGRERAVHASPGRDPDLAAPRREARRPWRRGAHGAPHGEGELHEGDEEAAYRACAARELHEEAGVDLPADAELVPWSRWVTPEVEGMRFDTRFYVALAPAHAAPTPDRTEITEVAWIAPEEALDRHERGQLDLVFPTIKNLETLLPYATADDVIAAAQDRVVEPILPKVLGTREDWRIVLPDDPDYP